MEQVVMVAQRREETGKGPARRLRAQGLVPGVAYGLGNDTVAICVRKDELDAALRTERGANVLLDLKIEGVKTAQDTVSIMKEVQRHPVTRQALSVDFQWISLTEKITLQVPVLVEGESPGVEEGGVVDQIAHEIEVACLPTAIPDHVVIDITGLNINDTLRVEDIQVPEGVELLVDPADPVVSIAPPISEEELEVRVAEELLEGLEEVPLEEEELVVEEAEEGPADEAPAEPEE